MFFVKDIEKTFQYDIIKMKFCGTVPQQQITEKGYLPMDKTYLLETQKWIRDELNTSLNFWLNLPGKFGQNVCCFAYDFAHKFVKFN